MGLHGVGGDGRFEWSLFGLMLMLADAFMKLLRNEMCPLGT